MLKGLKDRNMLVLHFTVLIWGFTGVLGELISISALPLVWYRVMIASISLYLYFLIIKKSALVSTRQVLQYLAVGTLVGLHWVLFFHSIKISTVSVTLVTLSSITLFTAILEPVFNKKRISLADILVGCIIIIGIYLIFKFETQYMWGIIYGLICAFCASIFSILNARMVKENNSPSVITFYEMIGAFAVVTMMLLISNGFSKELILSSKDWMYLLLLGVLCTAVAYVLGVAVMKELSAFTVALITNMEPVYGILLAMLVFGRNETMSLGFYAGAAIVLGAVFIYPYLKRKIAYSSQKQND